MLRHREFDVAEMSLSSYVVSLFADDPPFIAIPVFPSRFFRHSCIYVNAAAGIARPADLTGRTVGTPEYQMTAPVWIRGILADDHGVAVTSVRYATGGLEEPGRTEKLALDLPPGIRVALATFLRYSHEQGLSRRRLAPEDLFAPETLEAFKI